MTTFDITADFLDSPQGRVFVIHRYPQFPRASHGVVLVPPFAEEMNCSRRMLTLLAEALASCGYHVVLPDFYGTGDSEGDFSEASWSGWLEQLDCCVADMQNNYGVSHYSLIGGRVGALLLADYMRQFRPCPEKLVLWQPVIDGEAYLKQFLRLRLAYDMLTGEGGENTGSLIQSLADGGVVEVAGYGLTSAVADGLSSSALRNTVADRLPETLWIDLIASNTSKPPLFNRNLVAAWLETGAQVKHLLVVGESFWNSGEVVVNPEFVAKIVNFIKGGE